MIVGGVFDRFPRLKVVVARMGEGLPFCHRRFGEDLARIAKERLHKPVKQYFHDNLWIMIGAFFRDELSALAPAAMGLLSMGAMTVVRWANRRAAGLLARTDAGAQAGDAGRGGAGQQDGAHRLGAADE